MATTAQVSQCYAQQDLQGAAVATLALAEAANGYLSEQAPWSAIKDASRKGAVADVLYGVLGSHPSGGALSPTPGSGIVQPFAGATGL